VLFPVFQFLSKLKAIGFAVMAKTFACLNSFTSWMPAMFWYSEKTLLQIENKKYYFLFAKAFAQSF